MKITREEFEERCRVNRIKGPENRISNECMIYLAGRFSNDKIATAFDMKETKVRAFLDEAWMDKTTDPGLSPRVRKLLYGANINTYDTFDVFSLSKSSLSAIRGFGSKAIEEFEEWLLYTHGRKLMPKGGRHDESEDSGSSELSRRARRALKRNGLTENDPAEIAAIGAKALRKTTQLSAPFIREIRDWLQSKGYELAP